MKFKIGQKVVATKDVDCSYKTYNVKGIIKWCLPEENCYYVEFEEYVDGWGDEDLGIKDGYGVRVDEKDLKEINDMKEELIFAKVKEGAKIPTKRDCDAGRDLYACFDEDYIVIHPLETKLIPTGIATSFSTDYYAQIQERGTTGSKGIKYGAGVIEGSYRGEWFVPITNCNSIDLIIGKKDATMNYHKDYKYIWYPYEKAIAQFVMLPVPKFSEKEIPYEELLKIESERGLGALGSSGK